MYSFGLFFLAFELLSFWGLLFYGKRKKEQIHTSDIGISGNFLGFLFSFIFIGIGIYSELKIEDLSPELFGFNFSHLFGELTPLVQLVLNPFFSMGVTFMLIMANGLLVSFQLNRKGLLTIPYGFRLERDHDPDSSDAWNLFYSFLDGYQGKIGLSGSEKRKMESKLSFSGSGGTQPEESGRYYLVQYLNHDPSYHRFLEIEKVPKRIRNANQDSLIEQAHDNQMAFPAVSYTETAFDPDEYHQRSGDYIHSESMPPEQSVNSHSFSDLSGQKEYRRQKHKNALLIGLIIFSVFLCLGLAAMAALQLG